MSTRRERQLDPVRRAREHGQRRRALERARRLVLRRRQARVEVGDVLAELVPRDRVREVRIERGQKGWQASFRGMVIWSGGRVCWGRDESKEAV
ncbi:MAG: hypothetical protein ABI134_35230 [Byssovorax sp.]